VLRYLLTRCAPIGFFNCPSWLEATGTGFHIARRIWGSEFPCRHNTYRRAFQTCFYGRKQSGTECTIHVVVACPHLEVIDDEGREGGDLLAHSWQCTQAP
jgi:hypothetical protein